jgi:hypothetical protein
MLWFEGKKVLGLLLAVVALWCTGCYSRTQIKGRKVAPQSTMRLEFTVDPGLEQFVAARTRSNAQQLQQQGQKVNVQQAVNQNVAQVRAMPTSIAGVLRGDLLKYKIAVPLAQGDEANLELRGVFRPDQIYSVALDWQLVEPRSGAVVRAGVATTAYNTVEPLADQILEDLAQVDLNQYAKGNTMVAANVLPAESGIDDAPEASTPGQDAWAVIIGVENYREELVPATHAEADAQAFAAYAEKTLGVPPAHIKVLLGDRAGKADIASALQEWLPRNAVKPGGRVYVFFSGHGAPDTETGDAYLVPYDADPAYLKTRGYALKDLYATLGGLSGQKSLVVLDACFSGSGERSVLAAGTRPLVPVQAPSAVGGVASLAAASAKQTTGASGNSAHGLFTHYVLLGMQGAADANGDKNVTLAELSGFVREKVEEEARLQNREQTPTLTVPSGVAPEQWSVVEGLR